MPNGDVPTPALERWLRVQAPLWLVALACAWLGAPAGPEAWRAIALAGTALLLLSYAVLVRVLRAGHTVADLVTIARVVVLLGAMAAVGVTGSIGWIVWVALALALAGDLLDGACARRFGGSPAGAVLDMESDQIAFVALGLLGLGFAGAPALVLVPPALRYLKVTAHALLGLDAHAPRPRAGDNRKARLLCAVSTMALLACLLPRAPYALVLTASAVAAAALLLSYRTDLADLVHARAARAKRDPATLA